MILIVWLCVSPTAAAVPDLIGSRWWRSLPHIINHLQLEPGKPKEADKREASKSLDSQYKISTKTDVRGVRYSRYIKIGEIQTSPMLRDTFTNQNHPPTMFFDY